MSARNQGPRWLQAAALKLLTALTILLHCQTWIRYFVQPRHRAFHLGPRFCAFAYAVIAKLLAKPFVCARPCDQWTRWPLKQGCRNKLIGKKTPLCLCNRIILGEVAASASKSPLYCSRCTVSQAASRLSGMGPVMSANTTVVVLLSHVAHLPCEGPLHWDLALELRASCVHELQVRNKRPGHM